MKKKITLLCAAIFTHFFVAAQSVELADGISLTQNTKLACSAIKSQGRTGTCWSFATASFLEAEASRMGKPMPDISEMYFVRFNYPEKAQKYVRYHGNSNFGEGSLSHDVIKVAEKYGIVPESVYSGLKEGQKGHDHNEMFQMLDGMVKKVVDKRSSFTEDWETAFAAVLDSYLGTPPAEFEYEGKAYTPQSYAKEVVGFDADDYIELTSYTHHPFYKQMVLEVPDNWANGIYYNLPVDELEETIDYALQSGYTVAWDGDVSEKGFSYGEGMATVPAKEGKKVTAADGLEKELFVDQEMRQETFDNHTTTDDHLMHIVGTYVTGDGKKFYYTKNSWGESNAKGGYLYMSQAYVRLKTVGVLLHKEAIPAHIQKKLKI